MSCQRERVLLEEKDINLKEFLLKMFTEEPKEPSTYNLTLPEETQINEFLAYFVVLGAKQIYNRQLGELSVSEIDHLRGYLRSIGWDVEYKVENETESQVNYYLIDFVKI